jgi:hypothetical protein
MSKIIRVRLVGIASFVFVAAVVLSIRGHQSDPDENPRAHEASEKKKAKEGVTVTREVQQRIGIELQVLKPVTGHPEVTVYGTLEADPSEEFALRSPLSGVVVSEGAWPSLGSTIAAGATVGAVRPRLTAVDRLTLQERLAASRTEVDAAQSSAGAAREEVNRLQQLNADNKNASDKALREAETRLAAEEARLKTAQASVQLIGDTLRPESSAGSAPLKMRRGGQVVEVSARPGEAVESGQILIRVAGFNSLLARLNVPLGQTIDSAATRAVITPAGREDGGVPAQRVAIAASIDPRYQGQTLLFRIPRGKLALRPGQAVTARLAVPGSNERGVLIPSRAILRFQGQTWVYVQAAANEFVRSAVTLDHPAPGGWLAQSGFQPNQQVVVSGAQILLSEEMKSQLEQDQE